MTSIEFHSSQRALRDRNTNRLGRLILRALRHTVSAVAAWHRRRRDRAAFMTLVGKEDWVYRDMGITRGDVMWASHLPLHVNAARELERIRMRSVSGY